MADPKSSNAGQDAARPSRQPQKKAQATPTRRQAEAQRRERMNPTLSPKQAKARERQYKAEARQKAYQEYDASPERQLLRDVVDSRFNLGEIALPMLLILMTLTFIPAIQQYANWFLYAMWAFLLTLILDTVLMWRRFKKLVTERHPGRPLKGLVMYGFNRQLSLRRWRTPRPRVKRGEAI